MRLLRAILAALALGTAAAACGSGTITAADPPADAGAPRQERQMGSGEG